MKNNDWVEIFGMYYLYRFQDENSDKTLRFKGALYVLPDYLEEL